MRRLYYDVRELVCCIILPIQVSHYFFKSLIPVAGALLLVQGFAELVRCVSAMRTGIWPERLADVKETEELLSEADLEEIAAIHPSEK